MQKDPYLILGISRDASQDEIKRAYYNLRDKYRDLIFEEGEVGNNATRMLAEIDIAYDECIKNTHRNTTFSNFSRSYAEIEELIKNNNLEEAQNSLDGIESRSAEWHYLQAIIYYKRNWHIESKKQLEIALALDGSNTKYSGALERLNKVIAGANANQNQANFEDIQKNQRQQQRGGYTRPNTTGGASNTDACCNTCSCLLCSDCCCECMGGDLIACC